MSDDEMGAGDNDFSAFKPPPPLPEGVQKEVIKEAEDGQWKTPKAGDELTVHYVGTLAADGTQFDSSRDRGEPITFVIGKGQVIKGWDLGIASMKKGETAKFTIAPEYAYGEAGSPPAIPPSSTLVFEVELISWVAKDDVFGDGNVEKALLTEGSGWKSPKKRDEVCLSLKAVAADGTTIEEMSSQDYVVGSGTLGQLSRLVDKVLTGMMKGERCALKCVKDYLYAGAGHGEVTVTLVLEELYDTSDVSFRKDKTVMKKTVKEGDGHESPKDMYSVTLKVEACTAGSVSGPSLPGFRPQELKFGTGEGDVCDALEAVSLTMKKGERAVVTVTAPEKCRDPLLGLSEVTEEKIVFTLEMMNFEKRIPIEHWNLSSADKIELGQMKKEDGGGLFKKKRFELALEKYKGVTELLQSTDNFSNEQKAQAAELKKLADMNKAACHLQLGDPTSALSVLNTILKTDRYNVKALFRRAKAHHERGENVEAEADLEKVIELDPKVTEAKTLLVQVRKAQKVADKASKATFAKMCDGFGKLGRETKPVPKPPPPKEPEEETNKDMVTVTFRVEYKPQQGETVRVVGAPEALGAWDVEKGVPMRRQAPKQDWDALSRGKPPAECFIWESNSVEIPEASGRTEFRYAVRGPNGDRLETGDMHILQLAGMGGSRVKSADTWRD